MKIRKKRKIMKKLIRKWKRMKKKEKESKKKDKRESRKKGKMVMRFLNSTVIRLSSSKLKTIYKKMENNLQRELKTKDMIHQIITDKCKKAVRYNFNLKKKKRDPTKN
jgi:hypothetical protein